MYGFLYNGFELQYYNFEVFYMLRKLAVMMCLLHPDRFLRIIMIMVIGLGCLLVHARWQPCDNRDFLILDKLETMSLVYLVAKCGCDVFDAVLPIIKLSSPLFYDLAARRL